MAAKKERSKQEDGGERDVDQREQPASERKPGDEFRDDAVALEEAAGAAVSVLAELDAPLTTGNLKEFPRPSADLRAAEQGMEYFRESFERAGAMLYALAAIRDQGSEVDPLLLAAVQPFRDALRVLRTQHKEAEPGG
jgi:hypothetical protein